MDDDYINSHSPTFLTPEQYIKAKLKILHRDFYIDPTEAEIKHLYELKTQTAIDNAILTLIMNS